MKQAARDRSFSPQRMNTLDSATAQATFSLRSSARHILGFVYFTFVCYLSIGLPLAVAYAVCFFELLGGIGLLLGLLTRLAALAIITVMIGAIARVHWPHGFFINWELAAGKGHGFEANLAFIAMAVACVIAGGGAFSLDLLLMR